jgi:betaine reductase
MSFLPVVRNAAYSLLHVPDLVRYGSKPWREIEKDPLLKARLQGGLRTYEEAARYAPNRTFIGAITPDELAVIPRPWHAMPPDDRTAGRGEGRFGEILPQELSYAILQQVDVLEPGLVAISTAVQDTLNTRLAEHPVLASLKTRAPDTLPEQKIRDRIESGSALPLRIGSTLAGCMQRDERAEGAEDDNLDARTLLEGLAAKASASAALKFLLHRENLAPDAIDFIIGCGEEATGDRYQRGGGGLAKAIGEQCGCVNASGFEIKNFCAAPASALVTAGALVAAGIYERVAVVAGGSLAKLGMKFEPMLSQGLPILEDCLAAHAFLVTRDDGASPKLHIEPGSIGLATIGSSASDEAVYRQLLIEPLAALGLSLTDIDRFAPELHNPEIMEHAGSGDVAHKNYRMIAAMAVRVGAIRKQDMPQFIGQVGMPGFAPTQGHIPSGVAYIGHALEAMRSGRIRRAMILSKASLFLNRLTGLYDGVSFVLEANSGSGSPPREN